MRGNRGQLTLLRPLFMSIPLFHSQSYCVLFCFATFTGRIAPIVVSQLQVTPNS